MALTLKDVERVLLAPPHITVGESNSPKRKRADAASSKLRHDGLMMIEGLRALSVDHGALINVALSGIGMMADRTDAYNTLCVAARAVTQYACKGMSKADKKRFCNNHFGRGVTRRELACLL